MSNESSPLQVDVVVGIGAHTAGYLTHNQDDGTYLVLRPCHLVWDGYVGECPHPFDLSLEADGDMGWNLDAVVTEVTRKLPELDVIGGINDTEEAGYVVAALTEPTEIVVLGPESLYDEILTSRDAREPYGSSQDPTAKDENIYITDKTSGWKGPWKDDAAVIEVDLKDKLEGWAFPDRDQ